MWIGTPIIQNGLFSIIFSKRLIFLESFCTKDPEQGMILGDYVDFEEMKKMCREKKFSHYQHCQIVPWDLLKIIEKEDFFSWEKYKKIYQRGNPR